MPGTKRVINIGNNPDDGTGDLLRTAFDKINQNFDDVWSYTAVNSNLDITGDSINGTTDVIINPADGSAFKVTGDTIINPDGGNYNFTVNGDLANNVLYVQASTGRIGVHNTSPTVDFDVTGDVKISGMTTANNLTVTGNTVLGNANTDTVTYNAKAASNFLPFSTTQDIGAPSNRWGNVYTTNLDVSGSISGTFTGSMTSTLTGDVNNTNVTTVNLAATGPSNLHDVNITGNLVVQGTTTTLETTDVLVNNQLTFEGATADAHETILTVTDPTQDNTITFKNASGTVAFLTDVPTIINDLNDVDTSTVAPTNGQALVWNNADLEWQPGTVTGTGISYTDLSVTTNPVGTASLIYNSTNGEFTYTPPDLSSYLTSETSHADVLVDSDFASAGIMKTDGAGTYSIATDNSANWDTAYSWGDHGSAGYLTSVPAQTFASLTGKPTTIAGYGITDAFDGAFSSLSGKPTTIAGYGITDAFDGAFSSLSGKPTTIAGYGITDAFTNEATDRNYRLGLKLSNSSMTTNYGTTTVNQGNDTIAIGTYSAALNQGADSIAIGTRAAQVNQGQNSIAIGQQAANGDITPYDATLGQGDYAVAVGDASGYHAQGDYSVAIGPNSGQYNLGTNSIAIGRKANLNISKNAALNQTIVINAQNNIALDPAQADSFFVKPVRNASGTHQLEYNPTTGEISYDAFSGSTFGLAGNTGTHTFNGATETLTFLGTTGQINAGIAANNVTLELASDINSITSISFEGTTADANETKLQAVDPTADNTINLPDASGTIDLRRGVTMVDQATISTNSGSPTVFDIDTYKYYGITGTMSGTKYISIADGSYNGQEIFVERLNSAGTTPNWVFNTLYDASTDTSSTTTLSLDSGKFVWNGSAWVRFIL